MVNVLQAMILTDGPRMTLTPTYHVFHMYIPFQGATFLPADVRAPTYKYAKNRVPSVTVSAARDKQGNIQLALVNLDPNREARVTTQLRGASAQGASGRVLTAAAIDAHNTVDSPEAVQPTAINGTREGDSLVLNLPPKSVSVVRLQ
jgi:alpha-N-arabinofuranosidase